MLFAIMWIKMYSLIFSLKIGCRDKEIFPAIELTKIVILSGVGQNSQMQ